MIEFLGLLFSPSGWAGRVVWWVSGILIVFAYICLGGTAMIVIGSAINALDPAAAHAHFQPFHFHTLTAAEKARDSAAIKSVQGELYVIGGVALLVFWTSIVIEIKRWHDRGMSGLWLLTRWISFAALGLGHFAFWVTWLLISLFRLVQLGCLPGVESYGHQTLARPGGYPARVGPRGYPPRTYSRAYSGRGAAGTGFAVVLVLVIKVAFLAYRVAGTTPSTPHPTAAGSAPDTLTTTENGPVASAVPAAYPRPSVPGAPLSSAVSVPSPGSIDNNILNREHVESDSMTKTYGKDWVIADGERMNGITQVAAAPGLQVTIIYSNGGKNLPASSLPQAFLTQWGITPDMLAAANQPKTNQ